MSDVDLFQPLPPAPRQDGGRAETDRRYPFVAILVFLALCVLFAVFLSEGRSGGVTAVRGIDLAEKNPLTRFRTAEKHLARGDAFREEARKRWFVRSVRHLYVDALAEYKLAWLLLTGGEWTSGASAELLLGTSDARLLKAKLENRIPETEKITHAWFFH